MLHVVYSLVPISINLNNIEIAIGRSIVDATQWTRPPFCFFWTKLRMRNCIKTYVGQQNAMCMKMMWIYIYIYVWTEFIACCKHCMRNGWLCLRICCKLDIVYKIIIYLGYESNQILRSKMEYWQYIHSP